MTKHRQGFFLEIQTIIGHFQLTLQTTIFLTKPFVLPLFRGSRRHRARRTLTQPGNPVFAILPSPSGELIAVELLTAQQRPKLAMLAGIGCGKNV